MQKNLSQLPLIRMAIWIILTGAASVVTALFGSRHIVFLIPPIAMLLFVPFVLLPTIQRSRAANNQR
jgi:purine-cytosine permease-like protein